MTAFAALETPSTDQLPSMRERVSPEEWAVREDLAAAYRLVALYGWDDMIFTHLSARVPGTDHFLINPFGLLFEEITASSLLKIDADGNKVEESPYVANPAGFVIHSAIHMSREDAHCVMHLHSVAGQAVAAQARGLLPITQTAMQICDDVAYHDFEGIAVNMEERERLVKDLGDRHLMILRSHGTLTVGREVSDAFLRLYAIERSCEAQIAAQAGGELIEPDAEARAQAAQLGQAGMETVSRALAWPALRRRLDRLDASYAS